MKFETISNGVIKSNIAKCLLNEYMLVSDETIEELGKDDINIVLNDGVVSDDISIEIAKKHCPNFYKGNCILNKFGKCEG